MSGSRNARETREGEDGPEINPTLVTNLYTPYLNPAYAGMKGDSMDDNVDTFACGVAPIGFGLVVTRTASGLLTVLAGGPAPLLAGVALHDHIIAAKGGYTQYDAVSVMNRGKVWCQVV